MKVALIATVMLVCGIVPGASSSIANPGSYTLTILNNSNAEIRRMHISWSGTGRWGPDLLGKDVLRPRASFPIRNLAPGDYDILFIDAGGRRCISGPLRISADLTWPLTDRNCRTVG